jgi:diguanylate cyclase (GGDEF)-like protein
MEQQIINGSMVMASGEAALEVSVLMEELQQVRAKSERLMLLNELHARLSSALDLSSMIEAFSVWLMPRVPHELLAFDAPHENKRHLCCSCHGSQRREVMQIAENLFSDAKRFSIMKTWREGDYYVHNWHLDFFSTSGVILVLRESQKLTSLEEEIISEALTVLVEPLQRAMAYEELFVQAQLDSLTGLANRRVFDERIKVLIDSARRYGHHLTLVSMDLDHFKQVNDNLGHAEGDAVLKQVAHIFSSMIRSTDILARIGGDEFMLILPDTDLVSARILAERLCRAVDGLDIYSSRNEKLGVSIGLCQWQDNWSKEEWLHATDELLYQAKGQGRNRVCM